MLCQANIHYHLSLCIQRRPMPEYWPKVRDRGNSQGRNSYSEFGHLVENNVSRPAGRQRSLTGIIVRTSQLIIQL